MIGSRGEGMSFPEAGGAPVMAGARAQVGQDTQGRFGYPIISSPR